MRSSVICTYRESSSTGVCGRRAASAHRGHNGSIFFSCAEHAGRREEIYGMEWMPMREALSELLVYEVMES